MIAWMRGTLFFCIGILLAMALIPSDQQKVIEWCDRKLRESMRTQDEIAKMD